MTWQRNQTIQCRFCKVPVISISFSLEKKPPVSLPLTVTYDDQAESKTKNSNTMNGNANINELGADKNGNNTGVETPTKGTPENGILTPEQKSGSENVATLVIF